MAIRNLSDALIYDLPLNQNGLLWCELIDWWKEQESNRDKSANASTLYKRLRASVLESGSPGESVLFDTYYKLFPKRLNNKLPALIPQVHLHYDPRTLKERNGQLVLLRQRMDFLLLLENNTRVVIEVDGKQHYAQGDSASPGKYAEMVKEDRQLRLRGYELYRFGGAEFSDTQFANGKFSIGEKSRQIATAFFEELFKKHKLF